MGSEGDVNDESPVCGTLTQPSSLVYGEFMECTESSTCDPQMLNNRIPIHYGEQLQLVSITIYTIKDSLWQANQSVFSHVKLGDSSHDTAIVYDSMKNLQLQWQQCITLWRYQLWGTLSWFTDRDLNSFCC